MKSKTCLWMLDHTTKPITYCGEPICRKFKNKRRSLCEKHIAEADMQLENESDFDSELDL